MFYRGGDEDGWVLIVGERGRGKRSTQGGQLISHHTDKDTTGASLLSGSIGKYIHFVILYRIIGLYN